LSVREAVIAPESADGLAFIGHEGQCFMRAYGVAERLQLAVDGSAPQSGLESSRVEKDVDVF
jgi:hypothetical protein